ncbi:MAG: hypothetical protein ACFFAS_20635 [Promethearchaeota archaeon]
MKLECKQCGHNYSRFTAPLFYKCPKCKKKDIWVVSGAASTILVELFLAIIMALIIAYLFIQLVPLIFEDLNKANLYQSLIIRYYSIIIPILIFAGIIFEILRIYFRQPPEEGSN